MKTNISRIATAVVCACLLPTAWSASMEEGLINTFSQCDASFFHYLRQQQAELKTYAPIEQVDDVAFFKTKKKDDAYTVQFSKPLIVNGMKFIGFTEESAPLQLEPNNIMQFYYWTLIIKNTNPEAVASHFPQFIWHKQIDGFSTEEQIIDDVNHSLVWKRNTSAASNSIPEKNTVEKLLYLTKGDKGTVEMTCTLQGDIPKDLLYAIRPDSKGK